MSTQRTMISTQIIMGIVLLALPAVAWARLPPMPDANNEIFIATQAVVVSHVKDDDYAVEEIFLGTLKPKETITLPGFKLVEWQKMFGDPEPVEMTARTRILLFLIPDKKEAKKFVITYYGYAYFYREVEKIGELREMANKAVALRRQWENSLTFTEPKARLAALWPYVLQSPGSRSKLAVDELAKLNPLPGDYLAEHLASYSSDKRGSWMLLSRTIPSEKLHAASIADVKAVFVAFDTFKAQHHLDRIDILAHWYDGTLPEWIKNSGGEVYYGLDGINEYHDKKDLPFFREITPWLIKNQFDQALEECVDAMRDFPAPDNLPVLKTIWEDIKARHYTKENEPLLSVYVAEALQASKSVDAIPILKDMLQDAHAGDTAKGAIEEIQREAGK